MIDLAGKTLVLGLLVLSQVAEASARDCVRILRHPPGNTRISNQCQDDVKVVWIDQDRCSDTCSQVVPAGETVAVEDWVGYTVACVTTPTSDCTPERPPKD